MNELPTFSGARVVAHTTDDTTRRVFEHDNTNFRSWRDMGSSQDDPYLWRDSSELLDPVPVPCDPEKDEYLYYVPAEDTIPAGATYYRKAPSGNLYGPFDAGEPYPLARRNARNTYWTVDPLPEPAPEAGPSWWADLTDGLLDPVPVPCDPETEPVAGPSWWADLNDGQRTRLERLSGDQAALVADLIPNKPGGFTVVGDEGILPALHSLSSFNAEHRRYGLVLALDAFLGGDL